jgi:hypothetical protein
MYIWNVCRYRHTYAIEYYSTLKKEGNQTICDNMDKSGRRYANCNKPSTETQTLLGLRYMQNPSKLKPYKQRIKVVTAGGRGQGTQVCVFHCWLCRTVRFCSSHMQCVTAARYQIVSLSCVQLVALKSSVHTHTPMVSM